MSEKDIHCFGIPREAVLYGRFSSLRLRVLEKKNLWKLLVICSIRMSSFPFDMVFDGLFKLICGRWVERKGREKWW